MESLSCCPLPLATQFLAQHMVQCYPVCPRLQVLSSLAPLGNLLEMGILQHNFSDICTLLYFPLPFLLLMPHLGFDYEVCVDDAKVSSGVPSNLYTYRCEGLTDIFTQMTHQPSIQHTTPIPLSNILILLTCPFLQQEPPPSWVLSHQACQSSKRSSSKLSTVFTLTVASCFCLPDY